MENPRVAIRIEEALSLHISTRTEVREVFEMLRKLTEERREDTHRTIYLVPDEVKVQVCACEIPATFSQLLRRAIRDNDLVAKQHEHARNGRIETLRTHRPKIRKESTLRLVFFIN
jgi:hypothetical protein